MGWPPSNSEEDKALDEHDVPPIPDRPRPEGEDRPADPEPATGFRPAEFKPAVFTPAARDLASASQAWREADANDAFSDPAVALTTDVATTLPDAALDIPSGDALALAPS